MGGQTFSLCNGHHVLIFIITINGFKALPTFGNTVAYYITNQLLRAIAILSPYVGEEMKVIISILYVVISIIKLTIKQVFSSTLVFQASYPELIFEIRMDCNRALPRSLIYIPR